MASQHRCRASQSVRYFPTASRMVGASAYHADLAAACPRCDEFGGGIPRGLVESLANPLAGECPGSADRAFLQRLPAGDCAAAELSH